MRKIFSVMICAVMAVLMAAPGYALTIRELNYTEGDVLIGTFSDGTNVYANQNVEYYWYEDASGERIHEEDRTIFASGTGARYLFEKIEVVNDQLIIIRSGIVDFTTYETGYFQYTYNNKGDEVGEPVQVTYSRDSEASFGVSLDKESYAPGETMTVTVTGDLSGVDSASAYFKITYDSTSMGLNLDPNLERETERAIPFEGNGATFELTAPVTAHTYWINFYPNANGTPVSSNGFYVVSAEPTEDPTAGRDPRFGPPESPFSSAEPAQPIPAQPTVPTVPVQPPVVQPTAQTVFPTPSVVYVNGIATAFEAYYIDGNNYFKLRDIAFAVNNTAKQFNLGYDNAAQTITVTSGQPYVPVGGEMQMGDGASKIATPTASRIFINGTEVSYAAYQINGNNFFKMVDIAGALNIGIVYNETTKAISVDTNASFTGVITVTDAVTAQ